MRLPLSIFTIVFNGQPFIEANVRESLRQADHVSVVEGATRKEAHHLGNGNRITGRPDSDDGTREILLALQKEFPGKLHVSLAKGNFRNNKTQMVERALLPLPSGVLLQKDVDEFWFDWQVDRIRRIFEDGDYSELEFHCRHFWASPDYHVALATGLWGGGDPWRRAWLWNGESPLSHEPPRFRRRWEHVLPKEETRAMGLVFFHYSYADFQNVLKKERFYNLREMQLADPMIAWRVAGFPNPGPPGPMACYKGPHPFDTSKLTPWPK